MNLHEDMKLSMEGNTPITLRELLDRPARSATVGHSSSTVPQREEQEYVAFANGRIGNRPQLALMFYKADGSVKAYAYSHLFSIESSNPTVGFTVQFTGAKKVVVSGRNLQRLFQMVCEHRAITIVEAGRGDQLQVSPGSPIVELVEFG